MVAGALFGVVPVPAGAELGALGLLGACVVTPTAGLETGTEAGAGVLGLLGATGLLGVLGVVTLLAGLLGVLLLALGLVTLLAVVIPVCVERAVVGASSTAWLLGAANGFMMSHSGAFQYNVPSTKPKDSS